LVLVIRPALTPSADTPPDSRTPRSPSHATRKMLYKVLGGGHPKRLPKFYLRCIGTCPEKVGAHALEKRALNVSFTSDLHVLFSIPAARCFEN
jgi:hypothetical protein